jgi:hypothetical protein
MGLVAWIVLGYMVLLLLAGILAGSLCRVAKLSARHGQTARCEVVLWGRIPLLGDTAVTVATRGDAQVQLAGPASEQAVQSSGFCAWA